MFAYVGEERHGGGGVGRREKVLMGGIDKEGTWL